MPDLDDKQLEEAKAAFAEARDAARQKLLRRGGDERVKGTRALARLLDLSRHTIYEWEVVPSHHVEAVHLETGVSRRRLRPDLYG